MRRWIAPLALVLALAIPAPPTQAQIPTYLWGKHFGGTGNEVTCQAVASDASGDIYIAGSFYQSADFGGGALGTAGGSDVFLAKYNSAGVYQWSKRFGAAGPDLGQALCVDGSGAVFLAGSFSSTVDFGGGGLVSAGATDMFLAKYSSAGLHQWSKRFGSTSTDSPFAVATDASGDVFMAGSFRLMVDFGGGPLVSAGGGDVILAKYNSAGAHQWSQRFGSGAEDIARGLAVDASSNVVVTGSYSQSVNFGGSNSLTSAGLTDIFLAKYNSAGAHQWSERFGSTDVDAGYSVAVDAPGSVFMTGQFAGTVDFGGGGLTAAGSNDVVLAKYNSSGVHQWSKSTQASMQTITPAVCVDALGNVLLAGSFIGTVNVGGATLTNTTALSGLLAKFANDGTHRWSYAFGSPSTSASAYDVATDISNNVLLAGYYSSPVDVGGGPLPDGRGLLVKYAGARQQPIIRSISDIGNDQGRQVLIDFTASGNDVPASQAAILQYETYRRVDAPPPSAASAGDPARLSTAQLLAEGWTQVGSITAHGETGYTVVAPTIGDSTVLYGQYRTTFYLRATTSSPYTFYDSAPDSGYSLDNLAPAVPQNFVYNAGQLTWKESTAKDFDYFTVYGSDTNSFGAAAVVDYSVPPAMNVTASPYVYYYVTATDFSGNEGKPARVNTLSGVGGAPKSYVLSVSNYPNPFNPRTTLSYTVPSRGPVTVVIYDMSGARVATLVDHAERAAGAYSTEWDGHDDHGATVGSGVYFARIEQGGAVRSKKMVLLK